MSNSVSESPWLATDVVEEQLLEASQGNQEAELRLLEILKQAPDAAAKSWPEATRQAWTSGIDFLVEEWSDQPCSATRRELVLEAARLGLDSSALRDLLAAESRRRFTEYLDPAGMIDALAVLDRSVPLPNVRRRWRMFELLADNHACLHPVHGAGRIVDVDDLANEVAVQFTKKLSFATRAFLETLAVVYPGTALDAVCKGERAVEDAVQEAGSRANLEAQALALEERTRRAALETVLGVAKSRPKSSSPKAAAQSGERRWDEARSLAELLEILREVEAIDARDGSADAVRRLLDTGASRKDYAASFAEAVSRLRGLTKKAEWLTELLRGISADVWCWQSTERFAAVTDALAGRLLPQWLRATRDALGPERLAEYAAALPLRLWPQTEKALAKSEGGRERLAEAAVLAVKADPGSADAAMWLWKSKREERRELADAALIFRLLNAPVSGSYIKAAKQLRKLLLEDEEFQRFLLHDGHDAAITSLVQCARGLSVLASGETQSLLVRIVRLYPEAKPLVEKRDRKRVTKAMPKITSMRSYEAHRLELQDIINVRIPENSRAIAHARSYGDLRENAEYKAAKEEQAYLTARRSELETALSDIQATDFSTVEVDDRVIPGATVELAYSDGKRQAFHLMGLWDSEPDSHILSYDTPMGKLLLGSAVGDEITTPTGDQATIEAILPLSDELLKWATGES